MIKVTISDMKKTKHIFSLAELCEILSVRYDNEANSFEIVSFGKDVPHLTVMIKQNVGTLHYIESFEDAGFTPDNPDNNFDQNGFTTLYYGSLESTQEIWNRQIVSSADATRAAEEFAATLALPTAIRWVKL